MSDHLNLLPPVVRRRNLFWLRLRQWGVVWAVAVSLSVVGTVVQTSRIAAEHYRLSLLEESVRPLRATQLELKQMQQRLTILRSRESMLAMLERMEQPVQLLGIIGRSIGGKSPEVQVQDLVISPTQVVQAVKPTETAGKTDPAARRRSRSIACSSRSTDWVLTIWRWPGSWRDCARRACLKRWP